jgi:hypothetical protein
MDHIPRASELTPEEMSALRSIISRAASSTGTVSKASRERLLAMGLITAAMGLLIATPAGRIVARMSG